MKMAKEDLLEIRKRIAEKHSIELTPDEVIKSLNEIIEVKIVNEPGLLTLLKKKYS